MDALIVSNNHCRRRSLLMLALVSAAITVTGCAKKPTDQSSNYDAHAPSNVKAALAEAGPLGPEPISLQSAPQDKPDIGQALPADVVSAVQAAASVKTIYPIDGTETFAGQVLKADEIVFGPDSRLVLTAVDKPWIAIVARRIKFANPDAWTRIQRDMSAAASSGAAGSAGDRGPDNPGETNRTGNPGGPGADGKAGGAGLSRKLPHIYLIAGSFQNPQGQPLPGYMRLALIFPGVDGGQGGNGGRGGDGGNAGNGKEGATSLFDCKEGGGPGGPGGNAGRGGRGGNGGVGGDGADLTYVSLKDGIDLLSYARVVNVPGTGGQGGEPGRAGNPGRGGGGAGRNGYCGSTGPGPDGSRPDPRDLGPGSDGGDGKKGSVVAFTVGSLAPIFN